MDERLLKPYNPKNTEERIYKLWEESGFFNPDVCVEKGIASASAPYFSIVLPPPNATGVLHLGHTLEDSMQDTMIRYNRMQGKRTLWLPGTDHAAIATDAKVTKILEKEGLKKKDIGREKFLERVDDFVADSRKTIVGQLRKIGASLDWSREAFTLDVARNLAVRTAFKKMYDDRLIYRGSKIVNWDPKGQTVISDDEIVYVERKSKLYTFKYSKDFPIPISTTRPETKVGDVAVAVHPEDARYKQYVGKEYVIENFCGVKLNIKIIADAAVEKDFGTGALGVTPAHSIIDWEMAEKNSLPHPRVINEYAKMMVGGENLIGKKTTEAREVVVEWLKNEGLLENEEEVNQNIATAERTGGIIEPLPKLQWFVDVNKKIPDRNNKSLKELMLEPVRNKKINILPDHFEKVYFNWIENLRDWCISRQIWYGHRIPVWYKDGEIYCGVDAPAGEGWIQDEDTLDTWFSSGLWTFSTLGWPADAKALADKPNDLSSFHPTSVINPGYEILFFWVARMILMSQYIVGEIPFETVYLHGMLRDAKGQKFSKSLDNGVDPIEIIDEYGADALRMSMIIGIGPGADGKFDIGKVKAYRNFSNKIWNITRFILENTQDEKFEGFPERNEFDSELRAERRTLIEDVTSDMENFRFYLAGEKLYHYVWHRFADEIIEESKIVFAKGTEEEKIRRKKFLMHTLNYMLKALHPFMPFVTEEIWSMLPWSKNLLMVEKWPNV
ncbi:MAG TPA: valine--tRNA ligase [Candidatus Paceibacterota bacterium]|jgi:valyl-tRNA synthetase|nr:valine--tRNA ligase [Candidatus Paceibacterota bacterium]